MHTLLTLPANEARARLQREPSLRRDLLTWAEDTFRAHIRQSRPDTTDEITLYIAIAHLWHTESGAPDLRKPIYRWYADTRYRLSYRIRRGYLDTLPHDQARRLAACLRS